MTSTDEQAAIVAAVVATLREASDWIDEAGGTVLSAAADDLSVWVSRDVRDVACCPFCEEVMCDDGCPLHPVRDALGCWIGATGA